MTIGATYAADLSRVRIACSSAPALADYATIERSVDQISWFTVRGGSAVPLVANACQLDDYEFVPGQVNYYRARYVDAATPSIVAFGTLGSGVNASVTPGMPAGVAENDILVLKAAIRNTAATVNTPAGWNLLVDGGNFRVFTRVYTAGVVAPTVTFTGGVAQADTAAKILAVRNADFSLAQTFLSNASAQDVLAPAIAVAQITPNLLLRIAWKQSLTTLSAMTGWVALSRDSLTTGDDETVTWWVKEASADEAAGTFVMTGGVAALSKSTTIRFTRKPYVSQETATVTPTITTVWMKNLLQPFLNRKITVVGPLGDRVQASRSGSFVVAGRSNAFAVTDVRGGNEFVLRVKTETDEEREDLEAVLAAGDVVLLQLPSDYRRFPGGYYLIRDVRIRVASAVFGARRYFDLDVEETSAPSFALVGNTITWQGIINSYATWADVMAANATWADVMNRIGTPSDVVVP